MSRRRQTPATSEVLEADIQTESAKGTEPPVAVVYDPARAMADDMVAAALAANPSAEESGRKRGAVVVLSTASEWELLVAEAWGRRVLQHTEETDVSSDTFFTRAAKQKLEDARPLLLCTRDGSRKMGPVVTDAATWSALRRGRGILLVCDDLATDVPAVLKAATDIIIIIPGPTPQTLLAASEAVSPGTIGRLLSENVAVRVTPDHLAACRRLGQTAADFLDRLERIVGAMRPVLGKAPGSEWTLENLPLPQHVETWARQVVSDLGAYHAGELLWSEVDVGALLVGPPGCGKTTFAQALAASAAVPLFIGSYGVWESGPDGKSDYRAIMKNMRMTFTQARAAAPCIVFIDEIDSFIGRGQAGHNESWFTPLTNQLLAELDGSVSRDGVVVIAATNRPDSLDPALRRAGRLDRELVFPASPDAEMLVRIIDRHVPGLGDTDLKTAACRALGSSGADVERLARGARRRARAACRSVRVADLLAELGGDDREPRTEAVLRRTAIHEASHALVVAHEQPGALTSVTVRRNSGQAGQTSWILGRGEDTELELEATLREVLAGRAGEVLLLGSPGAGCGGAAHSDLATATVLAASAEMSWGYKRLTWLGDPQADSIPLMLATNPKIAAAVEERLQGATTAVTDLLRQWRQALDDLVAALIERETLTGAEAEAIIKAACPVGPRPDRVWAPSAEQGAPVPGGLR